MIEFQNQISEVDFRKPTSEPQGSILTDQTLVSKDWKP